MTRPYRRLLLVTPALILVLSAATSRNPPPVERTAAAAPPDSLTTVDMRNVDFYVDRDIPLRIRRLHGTMRSLKGGPVLFDDKRSFIIRIESADVGLTGKELSLLLNKYVFGYRGSPLSNLRITIAGNELIQKGTLHKVAALPFEMHAVLSATPDGRIRMHPTRTEIIGIKVDRLMKGLGLPLDKIIDLSKAKGAVVQENDILLDPALIIPPPRIEGRVSAVRIESGQVMMTFGTAPAPVASVPDSTAANYMYYRGGTLQFGKLIMVDADMFVTELDPLDAFQFDLDRYRPQLIAGYSRTLESGGLEVWMRDIGKLSSKVSRPNLD